MATGMTTITQVSPAIQNFYDGVLLDRALPYIAHSLFGQKRPVDQKSGNIAKFRRYNSLPASTAPLLEGVTPTALQLAVTDLTETLAQYGAYVEYTDVVSFINEDPVLTEIAELLGEHAGLSLDQIYRDKLNAGSSVFYASSVAGRSSIINKVATADFDKIRRALADANCLPFESMIKASTGVGTQPIRASYFCINHPDSTYDIENLTGFIPVQQYSNPGSALDREYGSYRNFRFVESTNAKIWADSGGTAVTNTLKYTTANTACDVYSVLIFGKNAYGITDLQGHALENIVKALGEGDDPLNQRGTSGWKSMTGLCILNDLFMYRYEHGVSA